VRFANAKKANLLCWLEALYIGWIELNERSDNLMGVVNRNDALATIGAIDTGLAAL
jgi:hypothetical protein